MPRLAPLPLSSELNDLAQQFGRTLGVVPKSGLIMQRKPKLAAHGWRVGKHGK